VAGRYEGLSTEQRIRTRADIAKAITAKAQREVLQTGRSLKCGEGRHQGRYADGCRNDGSSCICSCHDERAAQ
jgi:hypothetical protein